MGLIPSLPRRRLRRSEWPITSLHPAIKDARVVELPCVGFYDPTAARSIFGAVIVDLVRVIVR